MGGTSSKQDAFVGTGDHSKDEPPCSCLTPFFCPPEKQNQNSSSSRRSSFGSPLPDTPEQVRRIQNGYYGEANDGANRILKYDGLEREASGMFLNEMGEENGHGGSGGGEEQCAEIHDGMVSVCSGQRIIVCVSTVSAVLCIIIVRLSLIQSNSPPTTTQCIT